MSENKRHTKKEVQAIATIAMRMELNRALNGGRLSWLLSDRSGQRGFDEYTPKQKQWFDSEVESWIQKLEKREKNLEG